MTLFNTVALIIVLIGIMWLGIIFLTNLIFNNIEKKTIELSDKLQKSINNNKKK
jgi:hypothetical protein